MSVRLDVAAGRTAFLVSQVEVELQIFCDHPLLRLDVVAKLHQIARFGESQLHDLINVFPLQLTMPRGLSLRRDLRRGSTGFAACERGYNLILLP
jgi:hypothetical protein